ncbi:hypothetical protein [Thiohalophilus sp.]|uniref:hypothetical protein n=1 Tax=Thiohalophilus sp. TaxID=3028392 RepID=UPI002ACD659E|nr:hypothetical protein [Thiohalophilus sp.]MDZ7804548.1 hypothetical protein [Thiohalophilus sp.]
MLKWLWIVLGSTSTLGGLLVLWSPLPLGLPLLLIGIPLLMKYSPRSRTTFTWIAGHIPMLQRPLQRLNNPAKKPPNMSSEEEEKTP